MLLCSQCQSTATATYSSTANIPTATTSTVYWCSNTSRTQRKHLSMLCTTGHILTTSTLQPPRKQATTTAVYHSIEEYRLRLNEGYLSGERRRTVWLADSTRINLSTRGARLKKNALLRVYEQSTKPISLRLEPRKAIQRPQTMLHTLHHV